MLITNLYNSFIYDECWNAFPFVDLQRTKPLNPVLNRNMTSLLSLKIISVLEVLGRQTDQESIDKENT